MYVFFRATLDTLRWYANICVVISCSSIVKFFFCCLDTGTVQVMIYSILPIELLTESISFHFSIFYWKFKGGIESRLSFDIFAVFSGLFSSSFFIHLIMFSGCLIFHFAPFSSLPTKTVTQHIYTNLSFFRRKMRKYLVTWILSTTCTLNIVQCTFNKFVEQKNHVSKIVLKKNMPIKVICSSFLSLTDIYVCAPCGKYYSNAKAKANLYRNESE